MKKRQLFAWLLLAVLAFGLAACGDEPEETLSTSAGRMVQKIEITFHPEDEAFHRVYVTQENMNVMLKILRGLSRDEKAESPPDLESGISYYTATITRANGETSTYRLASHTFLQLDEGEWYAADSGKAMSFVNFIQKHPSDDSSVETTAAPETTAPAETTALPTT